MIRLEVEHVDHDQIVLHTPTARFHYNPNIHEDFADFVSTAVPCEEQKLVDLLKECRDMLQLCTLIDKSNQCEELVNKIDSTMAWNH